MLGLSFALIFCLLFLVPFGIILIRKTNISSTTFRYNAMFQLATLAAGSAAFSIEIVRRYWWKKIYQVLALVLVVVYAFQINKASMIMYYNNMRDFSIAERVLSRIELLPEYEEMENVKIIPVGFLDTQQGRIFGDGENNEGGMWTIITECPGIFNCQTIRIDEAMWLLSSRDKDFLINPYHQILAEDIPLVIEFLKEEPMHPWPAEDSIKVMADNRIILYLSDLSTNEPKVDILTR